MSAYGGGNGGNGVGVAPSNHVYGPANVHLLPCKVHHNGTAPVATYFRPAGGNPKESDDGSGRLDTRGESGKETDARQEGEGGEVKGGVVAILGAAGGRKDGQAWEHFEDDRGERTARFRGRKLV